MISTLASIVWLTSALSVPDSVISASSAKNDVELLGVSGLTPVLTSLSGYLTTSYYIDVNCKTLLYAKGIKLGACRATYKDGYTSTTITTVDQGKITVSIYTTKDCSTKSSTKPVVAYTDGACRNREAYRVSATRDAPTLGFMTRSVNIICS